MQIHTAYRKWFNMFSYSLMFWGVVMLIAGLLMENPLSGLWSGLWTAGWIVTLISICGIAFLAFQVFFRAEWPRTLSRIAEGISRLLPVGVTLGILSLFGMNSLLDWSGGNLWVNKTFFLSRMLVIFTGWVCTGSYFIYIMRKAGLFPAPHYIRLVRNAAGIFLIVMTGGIGLAAWDLIYIYPQLRPESLGFIWGHNMFAGSVPLIVLSLYIWLVIRILEEKGLLPFQLAGLRYVVKMKPDPGPAVFIRKCVFVVQSCRPCKLTYIRISILMGVFRMNTLSPFKNQVFREKGRTYADVSICNKVHFNS